MLSWQFWNDVYAVHIHIQNHTNVYVPFLVCSFKRDCWADQQCNSFMSVLHVPCPSSFFQEIFSTVSQSACLDIGFKMRELEYLLWPRPTGSKTIWNCQGHSELILTPWFPHRIRSTGRCWMSWTEDPADPADPAGEICLLVAALLVLGKLLYGLSATQAKALSATVSVLSSEI